MGSDVSCNPQRGAGVLAELLGFHLKCRFSTYREHENIRTNLADLPGSQLNGGVLT